MTARRGGNPSWLWRAMMAAVMFPVVMSADTKFDFIATCLPGTRSDLRVFCSVSNPADSVKVITVMSRSIVLASIDPFGKLRSANNTADVTGRIGEKAGFLQFTLISKPGEDNSVMECASQTLNSTGMVRLSKKELSYVFITSSTSERLQISASPRKTVYKAGDVVDLHCHGGSVLPGAMLRWQYFVGTHDGVSECGNCRRQEADSYSGQGCLTNLSSRFRYTVDEAVIRVVIECVLVTAESTVREVESYPIFVERTDGNLGLLSWLLLAAIAVLTVLSAILSVIVIFQHRKWSSFSSYLPREEKVPLSEQRQNHLSVSSDADSFKANIYSEPDAGYLSTSSESDNGHSSTTVRKEV